ncbi:InlB B-repeat-containing protein, partial [Salmonella enterica subsp. enterica serovar Enteritidis]|uniref:InlB B-repeat-containing protein n=1 Tax=Salmonella enterica TaxID=28901 RepID=UPI0039E7A2CC
PTFAGHSFKYWSLTNGGEAFDFSTPITSATTLYAVFAVNSYTVTFYTDDTCTAKHFEKTDADYGTIINESDVPALT